MLIGWRVVESVHGEMVPKMKTLGIIGGLGPETGCKVFMSINNRFRNIKKCQPNLLLENLPISEGAERNIIEGNLGKKHEQLLNKSIKRMNNAGVDFLAIPCNTVHVFMEELRRKSKIPILSIIEETAQECKRLELKKVGLLGSSKTIKEKLYEKALRNHGIEVIIPKKKEQTEINQIIIRIIHSNSTEQDRKFLINLTTRMKREGAESIILGCTDLPLLIKQGDTNIPLMNSLECLEDAALNRILDYTTHRRQQ